MKTLRKLITVVKSAYINSNALTQINITDQIDNLLAKEKYKGAKNLVPFGYKIYSQCDEDGIINEIFNRIGMTNKTFVEFGIGDGRENNSLALLFQDWEGLWIEGSQTAVENIKTHYDPLIKNGKLRVEQKFIDKTNIDDVISRNIKESVIDLLSIDIDGNDWHIFDAIKCLTARVIVFEYNAKFRPPVRYCMDYVASYVRAGDDCFGFSLQFITDMMTARGYSLVCCNLSGSNAFFVRDDLLADHFEGPFTAEKHYEPARYALTLLASGHQPSYQTLARSLTMRNA